MSVRFFSNLLLPTKFEKTECMVIEHFLCFITGYCITNNEMNDSVAVFCLIFIELNV